MSTEQQNGSPINKKSIDNEIRNAAKSFKRKERNNAFKETDPLIKKLDEARIDLSATIGKPPVCIEILGTKNNDSAIVATYGNFSAFIGKSKSGKTLAIGLIISSLVKGYLLMDKIKPTLKPDQKGIKIYDTEQGRYHVQKSAKRILELAAISNTNNKKLETFCLRAHAPAERLELIEYDIYNSEGLGIVVIDGIRDLICDINRADEATMISSKLLKWSEELNIHIIVVIHQNKNDNNARGHLGTEIMNKAETIISVTKDNDDKELFIVEADRCREREFETFAFKLNNNGIPYIYNEWVKKPVQEKKKKLNADEIPDETHLEVLKEMFSYLVNPKYSDLINPIVGEFASRTIEVALLRAKNFIKYYAGKGWIYTEKFEGIKYPVYRYKQPV